MPEQLSSDRLADERAFIKRYSEGLASFPVNYPADYSTPLEDRPRKVAVVQVPVADPPDVMDVDTPAQEAPVSITIKSLKPALTIPLSVRPSDSIASIKAQIASQPSCPAANAQRLLLKGKALVDDRLVMEYGIADGAVVHLMVKAVEDAPKNTVSADVPAAAPQLTISTEMPDNKQGSPQPLTISEQVSNPLGPLPQITSAAFHDALADPAFWQRLHALCTDAFANRGDADSAWETFLVSMKAKLSAGEAAKIRDVVGLGGMGGGAA